MSGIMCLCVCLYVCMYTYELYIYFFFFYTVNLVSETGLTHKPQSSTEINLMRIVLYALTLLHIAVRLNFAMRNMTTPFSK